MNQAQSPFWNRPSILRNFQRERCQQPPTQCSGATGYHYKSAHACCCWHTHASKNCSLHPATHMTRCRALIPLGGPAACGLNRRPYFTCRQKMMQHIRTLTQYCWATWITRSHTRPAAQQPYVCKSTQNPIGGARGSLAVRPHQQSKQKPHASGGHTHHGERRLQRYLCQRPFSSHGGRKSPAGRTHHNHTQTAGFRTLRDRTIAGNRHLCTTHTHTMSQLPHIPQNSRNMLLHGAPHARIRGMLTHAPAVLPTQPAALPEVHGHRGVRQCCGRGHHKVITPRGSAGTPHGKSRAPAKEETRKFTSPPRAHGIHTLSPLTRGTPQPSKRQQAAPRPQGAWMKTWTPPGPVHCSRRDMEEPPLNIHQARGTVRV